MNDSTVIDFPRPDAIVDPLSELIRSGARQLIQNAVELELQELLAATAERRLPDGRAAVVRSGYQPERAIQTGIGPVTVRIPQSACA